MTKLNDGKFLENTQIKSEQVRSDAQKHAFMQQFHQPQVQNGLLNP
ncbi:hypothetical protein [Acinetobacter sp. HY1485]